MPKGIVAKVKSPDEAFAEAERLGLDINKYHSWGEMFDAMEAAPEPAGILDRIAGAFSLKEPSDEPRGGELMFAGGDAFLDSPSSQTAGVAGVGPRRPAAPAPSESQGAPRLAAPVPSGPAQPDALREFKALRGMPASDIWGGNPPGRPARTLADAARDIQEATRREVMGIAGPEPAGLQNLRALRALGLTRIVDGVEVVPDFGDPDLRPLWRRRVAGPLPGQVEEAPNPAEYAAFAFGGAAGKPLREAIQALGKEAISLGAQFAGTMAGEHLGGPAGGMAGAFAGAWGAAKAGNLERWALRAIRRNTGFGAAFKTWAGRLAEQGYPEEQAGKTLAEAINGALDDLQAQGMPRAKAIRKLRRNPQYFEARMRAATTRAGEHEAPASTGKLPPAQGEVSRAPDTAAAPPAGSTPGEGKPPVPRETSPAAPPPVAGLEKLQLERAAKDAILAEPGNLGVPVGEPYGPPPPRRPEKPRLRLVEPQAPGGKVAHQGQPTRIFVAERKQPYEAHYALMELEDIQPSHRPGTFAKNPAYPGGVQERDYAGDKAEQMKVLKHAKELEPIYLLTNNPDPVNGPPIVTPEGLALGGNSRTMSISLAYKMGKPGERYRAELEKYAPFYGFDKEQVAGMREPVLVRVFEPGTRDPKALHRYASEFNMVPTQEMGQEAKTASLGRNVSPETLETVGNLLAHSEGTLREMLDKPKVGLSVLNRLVEDGAISQTQVSRYWSQKHRKLNSEGKALVERTILGSMIPDVEVLNYAPESILNKISGAIPGLARLRASEAGDISQDIEPALRLIMEAEAKGGKYTKDWGYVLDKQQGFEARRQTYTPRQVALAIALKDMGPVQFREAVKGYALDVGPSMFGPVDPETAFAKHFGTPPDWAGNLAQAEQEGPRRAAPGGLGFADTGGYADIPPRVFKITGDEFGHGSPAELRKRVWKFAKTNLFPIKVTNRHTGQRIGFNQVGIRKALRGGQDKYAVIKHLPELLQAAEYMRTEPPRPKAGRGVKAYHRYRLEVELGGELKNLAFVVRETSHGNFHYDHYVEEKSKGPAGTSGRGTPESGAQHTPADSEPFESSVGRPKSRVKGEDEGGAPPTGHADVGGYADTGEEPTGLEMPETVELATRLLGSPPRVVRRLRAKGAKGVFYPGQGRIELLANIFENPADALKTIQHEIGHAVDWLSDKDMRRGNILGRIASLKKYMGQWLAGREGGPGPLTEADKERLRKEAERLLSQPALRVEKEIDEEVERVLGLTPQDVLAIWKDAEGQIKKRHPDLYNYVAGLGAAEKKSIVKEALRGRVPEELKRFAKVVKLKTGRKVRVVEDIPGKKPTKKAVEAKLREMIIEEARKRQLLSNKTIREELKALTRMWKPFDPKQDPKYTQYRYSSAELYADALSVLLNRPDLLEQHAPEFYRGFFAYLHRKPEVKRAYDEIQARLRDPEAKMEARQAAEHAGFQAADAAMAAARERKDIPLHRLASIALIDTYSELLRRVKQVKGKLPSKVNPQYLVEESRYSAAQVLAYLRDQHKQVIKPLDKAGLTERDLGTYLKLRRIIKERGKLANPGGETPQTAQDRLDWMRRNMGKEKFGRLEALAKKFAETRKQVIDYLAEARMFSPELQAKLNDNEFYARFDVVKYLEKRGLGGAGLGYLRGQIGTLSPIANPLTATLLKDAALIRAANRKLAAKAVTDFLEVHFPDEIRAARRGPGGVALEPSDPEMGQIKFLHLGKVEAYNIPKYIAAAFKRDMDAASTAAMLTQRTVGIGNKVFKLLFVSANPGFMAFNLIRDFLRAWKNLPGGPIKSTRLLVDYLRGLPHAIKDAFGIPDSMVQEMYRKKMLLASSYGGLGYVDEPTELKRLLRRFNLEKGNPRRPVTRALLKFGDALGAAGQLIERLPKTAGYRYLKREFPSLSDKEIGHIIRTQIGSPDFLRRSGAHGILNNVLLFFNAWKEGLRGDWEALKRSPASVSFKLALSLVPKLMMYAAVLGFLGREFKDLMEKIPEYDKTNYVVVPLWETETGKAVYVRLPQDYMVQFVGGVMWNILNGRRADDYARLLDYTAGQAPALTPTIQIPFGVVLPYLAGRNPYDYFRGRHVIPEQAFKAGGWPAQRELLKYTWNQMGGQIIYKFKAGTPEGVKTELETVLGIPVVSNIAGRFIKVSNKGEREALRRATEDVVQQRAQRYVELRDQIIDLVNKQGTPPRGEIMRLYHRAAARGLLDKRTVSPLKFRRRVMRLASKTGDDPALAALHAAGSNEEKAAILADYRRRKGPAKFEQLRQRARQEGAISGGTMGALRKLERSR